MYGLRGVAHPKIHQRMLKFVLEPDTPGQGLSSSPKDSPENAEMLAVGAAWRCTAGSSPKDSPENAEIAKDSHMIL